MVEYRRGAHTVYEIHLHLVWTTKYRKAVLVGEAATRVRDLIREICGTHDVKIITTVQRIARRASSGPESADHLHDDAASPAEGCAEIENVTRPATGCPY